MFVDDKDVEGTVSVDSGISFFKSRLGADVCNAEAIVCTIDESDTNSILFFGSASTALLEFCVVETLSVASFSFASSSFCALELRASSTIFALASFNCLSKIFLRCSN